MSRSLYRIVAATMMLTAAGSMWSPVQALEQIRPAVVRQSCLTDLYYWRRDGREIMLGEEDRDQYCFYGLRIGESRADVLNTLRPAFTLMYELKNIGHQYLLRDIVYPDYYLAVTFDDNDRVILITYQKNQVYTLD